MFVSALAGNLEGDTIWSERFDFEGGRTGMIEVLIQQLDKFDQVLALPRNFEDPAMSLTSLESFAISVKAGIDIFDRVESPELTCTNEIIRM
jgi:hypothetical protein